MDFNKVKFYYAKYTHNNIKLEQYKQKHKITLITIYKYRYIKYSIKWLIYIYNIHMP